MAATAVPGVTLRRSLRATSAKRRTYLRPDGSFGENRPSSGVVPGRCPLARRCSGIRHPVLPCARSPCVSGN